MRLRMVYTVALLFVALLAAQPSWADETLFTSQTPAVTNFSNGPNYELGTAFTSDIAGQITAVRFWKASSESGTHVGNIWSSTGQLLASVTFANETASGWQQQALAAPLTIAPQTIYVVSVNTGATYFAYTPGGLSSQVTNEDLSSVVGNNGLAGTPGTFPTLSADQNNFFRDIVFTPAGAPLESGNNCNGTYSGAFNGNVTVSSGQTCILVNASITGNITLNGGSLAISDSAIVGNVQVQGGAFSIGPSAAIGGNLQIDPQSPAPPPPPPVAAPPAPPGPPAPPAPPAPPGPVQTVPGGSGQICGTSVHGDLQFQNSGAPLLVGSASPASCAGNYVGGNLTVQNNTGAVTVIGNAVSNNLTIQNNAAAVIVNDDTVTGNFQIQNNTAATTVNGNIVTGNLQDQNNTGPAQIFGNIVGSNLQCQANSSITGGGNTAGQKQGQCAAF